MSRKAEAETVTYVVWTEQNKFAGGVWQAVQDVHRVTVPKSWKVTFGPIMGQGRKPSSQGTLMPVALRFYEGAIQRACIMGVTQFCDERVQWSDAAEYVAMNKLTGTLPQVPLPAPDGLPF